MKKQTHSPPVQWVFRMTKACLWFSTMWVVGCTYGDKMPLPVDTAVSQARRKAERPKLFLDEAVDWTGMPFLVPYLLLSVTHDKKTSRQDLARRLWWQGEDEKADVVRVLPAVAVPPNLRTMAVCYRWAPCKLGFVADDAGFVLDVGSARSAGILEGDRVLSVGGARFETGHEARSFAFYNKMWGMKPGDTVEVVWIRPGVGKVQKAIGCEPNDSSHLAVEDSLKWEERPLQSY